MGEGGRAIVAIVSSILGLGVLSVILSQRAATSSVISSAGTALSSVIGAAEAPVTGGSSSTIANNVASLLPSFFNPTATSYS
jgi:hypothetical protein